MKTIAGKKLTNAIKQNFMQRFYMCILANIFIEVKVFDKKDK